MLRSLALISLLAAMAPTASGQNLRLGKQGSSLLLGDISFSYTAKSSKRAGRVTESPDQTDLLIGPAYGYFVVNGLMLGVVLDYHRQTTTSVDNVTESTTQGLLLGFRPAYYHPLMPSRALQLYVRGLLGFAYDAAETLTTSNGVRSSATVKNTGFAGGIGAGVAFGFGAYWGGVLQLGVDYTYRGTSGSEAGSNVSVDYSEHIVSVGAAIGVYF
ncbi:MAG: hypothetical protein ACI9OJ_002485 [Myxococcota bacterium]|jgi:hypothetical protein